jgi:transposase
MSYSQDFREFVVSKVLGGMPRSEAQRFFNISRDSLYKWLKKYGETGEVSTAPRKEYKVRKISSQALIELLNSRPDATLAELAEHFNCWPQSIHKRCVKLGITRKKKQHYILNEMKKKGGSLRQKLN